VPPIEGLEYTDLAIAQGRWGAAARHQRPDGVRIAFLLLAVLVYMSERFGLEVVLGAFLAGAMVSLLDREKAVKATGLQEKLEGIGFGIFIPIFFVAGGVISVLLFPALALRALRPA
jgi:Kef-type K+ transport system membrane component KefB